MSLEAIKQCIDSNDLVRAKLVLGQLSPNEIERLPLENSLYYSAKRGKSIFVSLFLEYADPFIYQETGKDVGLTPIHIATMKNHLEVVQTLLLHNYELLECETDENHHHSTPVNLAAELDSTAMLDFYLEAGADINKKDSRGHFPLWKTVRKGHYQNTLIILEKGGPSSVDLFDETGVTPLLASCTTGQVAITKLLLKYGASPNVQDGHGDAALHHAAQIQVQRLIFKYNLSLTEMHAEVFYLLLVFSEVDITIKNHEGDSAFDIIEIAYADLFDLVVKYKKWLRQKNVRSFQNLLQLSEIVKSKYSVTEITELIIGIETFIAVVSEENSKNSSGACVLVNSTKTPYKRKFLHLFKNGKLLVPDVEVKAKSSCPFGFDKTEEAKCPMGFDSTQPFGDSLCSNEESDADAHGEMAVCPVTGMRGQMPHGHSTILTPSTASTCPITKPATSITFSNVESNGMNANTTESTKSMTQSSSAQSGGCPVMHGTKTNAKSTSNTNNESSTCPFSPNYIPTEEDERLPECTQQ